MNDKPVTGSNITLMIQHCPYYVKVSMLQHGNRHITWLRIIPAVKCQGNRLENECPICLICQCRANKELCKHCTVSTLVRVILFDSLQCLIRTSSPLYTLTGKEIQPNSFTFITDPGGDTICSLMDQQDEWFWFRHVKDYPHVNWTIQEG